MPFPMRLPMKEPPRIVDRLVGNRSGDGINRAPLVPDRTACRCDIARAVSRGTRPGVLGSPPRPASVRFAPLQPNDPGKGVPRNQFPTLNGSAEKPLGRLEADRPRTARAARPRATKA